jgi:hypothetical protein
MSNELTTSEADHLATYILQDINNHYETIEQLVIDRAESFMACSTIMQVKVLETMVSKLNTTDRMTEKVTGMIEAIYRRASFTWPEKFSN